jgi:hypothetical protein
MHEGQPFIGMQLLEGQTLKYRIARGPLKAGEILDLGIQLADAQDASRAIYTRKGGHDARESTEDEQVDAEESVARLLVHIPGLRRHLGARLRSGRR